jgi:hypothetical protein
VRRKTYKNTKMEEYTMNKDLLVKAGAVAGKIVVMGAASLATSWINKKTKDIGSGVSGEVERGVKHFWETRKKDK